MRFKRFFVVSRSKTKRLYVGDSAVKSGEAFVLRVSEILFELKTMRFEPGIKLGSRSSYRSLVSLLTRSRLELTRKRSLRPSKSALMIASLPLSEKFRLRILLKRSSSRGNFERLL